MSVWGLGERNECLRERVGLESHCHSWRSKYSNQRVLPPLGICLTVDQINVNPNASWCLDFKESSREEFSSAATRIVYRRCGTIHYTEPRETWTLTVGWLNLKDGQIPAGRHTLYLGTQPSLRWPFRDPLSSGRILSFIFKGYKNTRVGVRMETGLLPLLTQAPISTSVKLISHLCEQRFFQRLNRTQQQWQRLGPLLTRYHQERFKWSSVIPSLF